MNMALWSRAPVQSTPAERERVKHYTENITGEVEANLETLQDTLDDLRNILGLPAPKPKTQRNPSD